MLMGMRCCESDHNVYVVDGGVWVAAWVVCWMYAMCAVEYGVRKRDVFDVEWKYRYLFMYLFMYVIIYLFIYLFIYVFIYVFI